MHPRRFGRVVCQFVDSSLGEVTDMSAGGMRLLTLRAVPPLVDDVVAVELVGVSGVANVTCRIAWVSEAHPDGWAAKLKSLIGGKRYVLGLEFVNLSDEARQIINEVGSAAGKNEVIRPDIERFRKSA
ncbi:MAG: PilZ domain-containing protein [Phycisphaerales bacterium]|nr:PilZ domain-containing protein [Phycisphaerales bacterium]